MQLSFLELKNPTTPLWEKLDRKAQRALVQALAQAIEKAIRPHTDNPEESHER